jgi:hypothetical protein
MLILPSRLKIVPTMAGKNQNEDNLRKVVITAGQVPSGNYI